MNIRMIAITVAACLAAWPLAPLAQPSLTAGHRLATQRCGACHAVGLRGQSPNPHAPPFRELGVNYPLEALGEALGEGMFIGHMQMPAVVMEPVQIGDLIAYMKTLQKPDTSDRKARARL